MLAVPNTVWWQHGIVYEIYPRSFQDSNGGGIGDLEGIRRRLDYLGWLGVDAIWIAPIYPSPMTDGGYDVSDYRGIDPIFGTSADFERLLMAAHGRDFVPNHTSDQHCWCPESRSSRDNNWLANFGGSGWEHDAVTSQYYYHAFLKEELDLNWRNPGVRTANVRCAAVLAGSRR